MDGQVDYPSRHHQMSLTLNGSKSHPPIMARLLGVADTYTTYLL